MGAFKLVVGPQAAIDVRDARGIIAGAAGRPDMRTGSPSFAEQLATKLKREALLAFLAPANIAEEEITSMTQGELAIRLVSEVAAGRLQRNPDLE